MVAKFKTYERRQSWDDLYANNVYKLMKKGIDVRKVKFTPYPSFTLDGQVYNVNSYSYNDFINNYLKKINDAEVTIFFLDDKTDEYHFEVDTEIVRFIMIKDEMNIKFPTIDEFIKTN